MKFSIPPEVIQLAKKIEAKGFEIYLVGGAVRDLLMQRPVVDWDLTTSATPEQIQAVLGKEAFYKGFGTVGFPAKSPDFKPHEVTTFRREFGYTDRRRPDRVEWGKSLKEDLKRRDFTINAMALNITGDRSQGQLIDPHGGQKDLTKKLIRAVGEAHERFAEDALRMMRAVRIAAELGFTIEEKTVSAIAVNHALIARIARERIRDELLKILASPNPYNGILLLRETQLLEEILPELEKTFGVEQKSPQRHHKYDVGTHSLLALKNCQATDPIVRLATLIHDIGKPPTYKKQANGVITFYNHEVVGARIAREIGQRLRLPKKDAVKLYRLVRWHQFTVNENQTDSALRRFIRRVGVENLEEMLELRRADRLGGGATETSWRTEEFKKRLLEVQKQPFGVQDLKITGHDVMRTLKIKPGPKIGEILNQIFEEVEAGKLANEKKVLLARLKRLE